jgi:hypothetical protein
MQLDGYTKVLLTIIALALLGNLLKPAATPSTVQAAGEGRFGQVQANFTTPGTFATAFFDTHTGELAVYNADGSPAKHYRLVEVGKPLHVLK